MTETYKKSYYENKKGLAFYRPKNDTDDDDDKFNNRRSSQQANKSSDNGNQNRGQEGFTWSDVGSLLKNWLTLNPNILITIK
jgi:hypothetical protein